MKNWGIRAKVLMIALIPALLMASTLGVYFVFERFSDLTKSQEEQGQSIARQLAHSSEYGVVSGNTPVLSELVETIRSQNNDVFAIGIFDDSHLPFIISGSEDYHSLLKMNVQENFVQTELSRTEGFLIVNTPIFARGNNFNITPLSERSQTGPNKPIGYVSVVLSNQRILLRQYQTISTSIFILFLGLFISGMLAQRLTQHVTHPIIQLASAVDEIREGKLDSKVRTQASGELQVLEDGINAMTASLINARDEMQNNIEQATADLRQTLETIEVQNIELDLARKQALDASRVKSEFLANMSHEIRTPMNSVIGFTKLLLKTALTDRQQDYLMTISNSAESLLAIIDDILDFSKIEAGKMTLEKTFLDLRLCVEEITALLAPQAQNKGLELIPVVYSDVPEHILGDRVRIKQILTNLLNNAIKFTEVGSVVVRVMLEKEEYGQCTIGIGVTDTGIGMTEEQKKQLFKAFSQADTTTTRRFGGTGLGLVISKKLVEKMGGEIGLNSSVGEGSTFWFTFVGEKDSEVQLVQDSPDELLASRQIFLHDKHSMAQSAIEHMLGRWHINCTTFKTDDELLIALHNALQTKKHVDCIVLGGFDIETNFTILKQISRLAKQLSAPIIAMLNSVDTQVYKAFTELGVSICLSKPITTQQMFQTLHNQLALNQTVALTQESKSHSVPTLISKQHNMLTILAVDDNPANLKLVRALLEQGGFNVLTAENGLDAVQAAKKQKFDVIFMDVQMPEMDGIEAARTIRANPLNRTTPIIALTAHAMSGEKEALLNAGMDDYMTKPVSEAQLLEAIRKWTQDSKSHTHAINHPPKSKTSQREEPAVDWEMSLRMAGGKKDLAQDLLSMLVASIPSAKSNIQLAYRESNYEQLLTHVHKFHGATCYTGVNQLKQKADQLETALKMEKIHEVDEHINELFYAMEAVIEASDNYLKVST